jgi:hypothetical protein
MRNKPDQFTVFRYNGEKCASFGIKSDDYSENAKKFLFDNKAFAKQLNDWQKSLKKCSSNCLKNQYPNTTPQTSLIKAAHTPYGS